MNKKRMAWQETALDPIHPGENFEKIPDLWSDFIFNAIQNNLHKLYTPEQSEQLIINLKDLLNSFQRRITPSDAQRVYRAKEFSPKDFVLVTYANSLVDGTGQKTPLQTLKEFVEKLSIKKVHLLPFCPWDTDRGFSILDPWRIDRDYGTWQDIHALSGSAELMFDVVANHASIDSAMIQGALISKLLDSNHPQYAKFARYKNFALTFTEQLRPSPKALENLVRPRPGSPLKQYHVLGVELRQHGQKKEVLKAVLGKPRQKYFIGFLDNGEIEILFNRPAKKERKNYQKIIYTNKVTHYGEAYTYATFTRETAPDGTEYTRQIDLNYANPAVLFELLNLSLFYIEKGASLLRLDAIGYLWKKFGSTCLHEEETHLLIQIVQLFLSLAAPGVTTIAEVNEPQDKAFAYLEQDGQKEVDLVYQFTHLPLAIHALLTENTVYYKNWLKTLPEYSGRQFVLPSGSHDGMGLKPLRGILPEAEIARLEKILIDEYQVLPNQAVLPGNKTINYELCATPWNLVNAPESMETFNAQLKRYLAVLALGLAQRGLPGIYINGLLGAANNTGPLDEHRTINREIFEFSKLAQELAAGDSQKYLVLQSVLKILENRSREKAFAPDGPPIYTFETNNQKTIAEVLESPDRTETIIQIVNFSLTKQTIAVDLKGQKINHRLKEIFTEAEHTVEQGLLRLELEPYELLWLKSFNSRGSEFN